MRRWIIEGGQSVEGRVEVQGSSSLGLFALALSVITEGPLTLQGLPQNNEIHRMCGFLEQLGMGWTRTEEGVRIDGIPQENMIPYGRLRKSETLLWFAMPLLLRQGSVRIAISPYDPTPPQVWFELLVGLERMGVSVTQETGYLHLHAKALRGADLRRDGSHPFSTTHWMIAALGAEGQSILSLPNDDLLLNEQIAMLQSMGALIQREGDTLFIQGCAFRDQPILQNTTLILPADPIETGLLLLIAAATGGKITLEAQRFWGMDTLLHALPSADLVIDHPTPKTLRLSAAHPCVAPVYAPPLQIHPALRGAWWAWLLITRSDLSFARSTQPPSSEMLSKLRHFGVSLTEDAQALRVGSTKRLHSAEVSLHDGADDLGILLAALSIQGRSALQESAVSERLATLPVRLKQLGVALSVDGEVFWGEG